MDEVKLARWWVKLNQREIPRELHSGGFSTASDRKMWIRGAWAVVDKLARKEGEKLHRKLNSI